VTIPARWPLGVVLLFLLGTGECEPRGIGRPCDVQAGADPAASVIDDQALACPTRLCLREPAATPAGSIDTAAFCTASCQTDADCSDAELRDPARADDRRCRSGFTCGIGLHTGAVACCRKLCLCRDFVDAHAPPPQHTECDSASNPSVCPLQPLE
jgi:hypothetical protein